MNTHSMRTVGLLAIVFIISGLQALHGAPELTQYAPTIDTLAAILLGVEHMLQGNTQ